MISSRIIRIHLVIRETPFSRPLLVPEQSFTRRYSPGILSDSPVFQSLKILNRFPPIDSTSRREGARQLVGAVLASVKSRDLSFPMYV